jgi:hypothetical protein
MPGIKQDLRLWSRIKHWCIEIIGVGEGDRDTDAIVMMELEIIGFITFR